MGNFIRSLQDFLSSSYVSVIISLSVLLGAILTIMKFGGAIRKIYQKNIWPALPGFWKVARRIVIPLAFFIALIAPVGYAVWYFLYLFVTRFEDVYEPSVFLSLFYQETAIIVVYCIGWASAVHFWLIPWMSLKKGHPES